MNEPNTTQPDWQDPLFLASKRIDGDLSPDESRLLEAKLAESAELREEVARLESVARMIHRASLASPTVDATYFRQSVLNRIEMEQEPATEKVDDLLDAWSRDVPTVDGDAFRQSVLGRLGEESSSNREAPGRSVLFRIGIPMAAAAALLFAVTALWQMIPGTAPTNVVTFAALNVTESTIDSQPARNVVAFARESRVVDMNETEVHRISVVTVSIGAPGDWEDQPPPL